MDMLEDNRGMGITNILGLHALDLQKMPILLVSNRFVYSLWVIMPLMDNNGCRSNPDDTRHNCCYSRPEEENNKSINL